MSSEIKDQNVLALELTEVGLSLFNCEGDVPVECLAHVDLDDADFAKKLSTFRTAAEKRVGKGFETEIWLPDDQVMVRSIRIDDEAEEDRRAAAASALSASTPFHGETMCFDLGETNGAGYTPVAAVPRDKMDEAMAFAKKMRMNPTSISTSNVVAGFSARPEFAPYIPAAPERSVPVRMAALAALLAAPILLLSSELGNYQTGVPESSAFVATVATATTPEELSEINVPGLSVTAGLDRAAPAMPAATVQDLVIKSPRPDTVTAMQEIAPLGGDPEIVNLSSGVTIPASIDRVPVRETIEIATAQKPLSLDAIVPVDVVMDIAQPFVPASSEPSPVVMVAVDAYVPSAAPARVTMTLDQIDEVPDQSIAAIDYVQNLFEDGIVIQDLVAVEETPAETNAPRIGVEVANIAEGVLVRRPFQRSEGTAPQASRDVTPQPSLARRPSARPLPALPEEALDFETMTMPTRSGLTEDPEIGAPLPAQSRPKMVIPEPLTVIVPQAVDELITRQHAELRTNAIEAARLAANAPEAILPAPKPRDIVLGPGGSGTFVQVKIVKAMQDLPTSAPPIAPPERWQTSKLRTAAATRADFVVSGDASLALNIDGRSIDLGRAAKRPGSPSERLTPVDGDTEPLVIAEIDPNAPLLRRPPSRRDSTADGVVDVDEASDVSEAGYEDATSAAIAAAAAQGLNLSRPPSRPEAPVAIARLVQPDVGPNVSKYAIDQAFAPINRPATLKSQAEAILKQRASVSAKVARKQEPVKTTPTTRLRIPTSARVATAATIQDGISLGDISLIGIFGTSKKRRALVRLPQGRYVQISRGDRVSGWTVSAVGEDAVRIQRGGSNKILRLPN